ncbi:hypothetical protein B1729_14505 [Microbacterium sp. B35-04]|nr:hypothetical protein B1729_14505 [Microbacterium sp. B35-04]
MPFTVKLTCRGTARYGHSPRTVAQFHYDGGWARVYDKRKQDLILQGPTGEIRRAHRLTCERCARNFHVPTERLYSLLDYAREHSNPHVPLG